MGKLWSDEKLVTLMQGSSREANEAIENLFQYGNWRRMFQRKYLPREPKWVVDDLFYQTIMKVFLSVKKDGFEGRSSLSTYFMGIGRNITAGYFREQKKREDHETELSESIERMMQGEISLKAPFSEKDLEEISAIAATVGKDCDKVLEPTWWVKPRVEIAELLSLKNADQARKKIDRCMKRLRAKLRNHPRFGKYLK